MASRFVFTRVLLVARQMCNVVAFSPSIDVCRFADVLLLEPYHIMPPTGSLRDPVVLQNDESLYESLLKYDY